MKTTYIAFYSADLSAAQAAAFQSEMTDQVALRFPGHIPTVHGHKDSTSGMIAEVNYQPHDVLHALAHRVMADLRGSQRWQALAQR